MQNTIVHNEGAASLEGAVGKVKLPARSSSSGWTCTPGLYVVVAQYDHLLPKPARRFAPAEFVPWVEGLLRRGHSVHVVYEACGFGFGLYRELTALGAPLLRDCAAQTRRAVHPGKDRSARRDDVVPATLALRGGQHAGAGRDPGAERSGGTSPARFPATRTTGPVTAEVGGPGAQFAHQSQSAGAGSLVEEPDLVALKQIASGLDLSSPGSSPAGLVDPGATDQRFECGAGSGRSRRYSRRRGQTNYRSDDPRDLLVGALFQSARHQFVHRALSGRTQQRQQTGTRQRDQTWQPAIARRAGGMCLAHGALPAQYPPVKKRLAFWQKARARSAPCARKPS